METQGNKKKMSELKEKGLGVFINLDKWGISTFTLKIIAMITMIIDHVGFCFSGSIIRHI